MTTGVNIAEIAALIGDPGRANMLAAVIDGRALTASELAHVAGITPATASGHLAKLTEGGLLVASKQGRHRYFGLASREVARMLESIMVVAKGQDGRPRATPRVPPALVEARTCYDHLAGRLGVALADALVTKSAIVLTPEAGEITASGRTFLHACGLPFDTPARGRRLFCRPCLDWSERRPHLAGVLGAGLLDHALGRGWIMRQRDSRAVSVTPVGRRAFAEVFGIDTETLAEPSASSQPLTYATVKGEGPVRAAHCVRTVPSSVSTVRLGE